MSNFNLNNFNDLINQANQLITCAIQNVVRTRKQCNWNKII